jgi:hypothetical protein
MADAKINQPFKIYGTITADGAVPTNPITAVSISYWNVTDTNAVDPTGSWTGTVLDGDAGTWEYNIPADVLNQAGTWKLEVNATSGGLTFPAESDTIEVILRGR